MTGRMRFSLVLSLLMVTGCQTPVPEGATPAQVVRSPHAPHAGIRLDTVHIVDPNLQHTDPGFTLSKFASENKRYTGKIAVENQGGGRSPTGTLEVFVVLRNRTSHPLQVEGRVLFFDKNMVPVEGPTAWERIYLEQNGIGTYKALSTLVNTSHYYVELREGR
ncbi:MAG: hypothetical protein HQL82_17130 [Magnetococcales bacterium]|nr:hypothetical protein [Magnetococcales bacterium]